MLMEIQDNIFIMLLKCFHIFLFLFFCVIFYKFWLHNPEHIDSPQKKRWEIWEKGKTSKIYNNGKKMWIKKFSVFALKCNNLLVYTLTSIYLGVNIEQLREIREETMKYIEETFRAPIISGITKIALNKKGKYYLKKM